MSLMKFFYIKSASRDNISGVIRPQRSTVKNRGVF